MQKKHISIIGACTSRNLFNSNLMKERFEVDCYAFQRCTWDLFGESLNISKEDIYNLNIPEFTARMLWYGLDKTTIQEIENRNSEYLMIDLHQMRGNIYNVKFNNKEVYFQRTGNLDPRDIEELKKNPNYHDIKIETIDNIDEDKIKNGLTKLVNWAKLHFDENKIIIHFCKTACFFRRSNQIHSYPEEFISKNKIKEEKIKTYTQFLKILLPNAIYLEDGDDITAIFNSSDDLRNEYPPSDHLSGLDLLKTSIKLLESLGIQDINKQKIIEDEYNFVEESLNDKVINLKDLKLHILNLNNYFENIKNLDDYIVIMSVKDEAYTNSKYFRAKSQLKLSFNLSYRDSYIAIVDSSSNFVYEENSKDVISYTYKIGERDIEIKSAGYESGSFSKIVIDGVDYSPNKRGLNIVLIRKKDFAVIEKVHCDLLASKDLFVEKYY